MEAVSGKKVRSFSVPYGSSEDLTSDLVEHLKLSGHEVAFLSESVANLRGANPFQLDRVSTHADNDGALFFQIEVLPRLRRTRNRLYHGLKFLRKGRKDASSDRIGMSSGRHTALHTLTGLSRVCNSRRQHIGSYQPRKEFLRTLDGYSK